MRETSQPPTTRFITWSTIAISLILLQVGQAAESHLPAKAQSVATKFESYQKTATVEQIETKRQQVVAYLGTVLKAEAANANLDSALAVKTLIDCLTKPIPQEKQVFYLQKALVNNVCAGL